jgi:hypothetical protein
MSGISSSLHHTRIFPPPLPGEDQRWGLTQRVLNNSHYGIDLHEHVMIPESQDRVTLISQPVVSFSIVRTSSIMLSAINFNHDAFLQTDKIDDIMSYWPLTTKFIIDNLAQA